MKYRPHLPHLNGKLCLADGGLETVLIFQKGIDLPGFASFTMLDRDGGAEILRDYFRPFGAIARTHRTGLLLDSATWRANPDWGWELGYDQKALDDINRRAIAEMETVRAEHETPDTPVLISGCIGPRGDGYVPSKCMTAREAETYHKHQVRAFADSATDVVTALTLNYPEEAIGIVRAAERHDVPVAISFTVETDGCLPGGLSVAEAIARCDAETGGYAAYYMINCAHPVHFRSAFESYGDRLRGLRANASKRSHAELDEATELDEGDPHELGAELGSLKATAAGLSLFGGCCGTDHRHIEQIARAVAPVAEA